MIIVNEEFKPGDKVQIHTDSDGWFGDYEIVRKATDKDYSDLHKNFMRSYRGNKYVVKNNHPGIFKDDLTIETEYNIRRKLK